MQGFGSQDSGSGSYVFGCTGLGLKDQAYGPRVPVGGQLRAGL